MFVCNFYRNQASLSSLRSPQKSENGACFVPVWNTFWNYISMKNRWITFWNEPMWSKQASSVQKQEALRFLIHFRGIFGAKRSKFTVFCIFVWQDDLVILIHYKKCVDQFLLAIVVYFLPRLEDAESCWVQ